MRLRRSPASATRATPSARPAASLPAWLEFGDIDELKKAHGSDLVSETTVHPGADMTKPSLVIKVKPAAQSGTPVEVAW